MTIHTPKYQSICWLLIWLGVSALSWYLVYLKQLGLDFHTRDYAFYTEFILKLGKPAAEQYYSINPGGYNFLGVSTVDGCNSFYQWIHVEPIRFIQAFIFHMTHSLHAVFMFNSLLVCSPVLAIPFWLKKTSAGIGENLMWTFLFIVFPATLITAGYDNRPSMFLGIGYFWILFSHLATKNKWIQLGSFFFLFLIREEAIILNGVVCLYMFFRFINKDISITILLVYISAWIVYVISVWGFYQYWDTSLFQHQTFNYNFNLLGILFLICLAWMFVMYQRKKYHQVLFLPLVFFLFQVITMYYSNMLPDEGFQSFNDPRNSLWFACLFAMLIYVRVTRYKGMALLAGILSLCFVCWPLMHGRNIFTRITNEQLRIRENQLLMGIKEEFRDSDILITDYYTHQAFIDRKNNYCFQRLPCRLNPSPSRFFPENLLEVGQLIRRGSWILIHRNSFETLKGVGLVNESNIFKENEKYLILRKEKDL